jgi:hypothetical protein
MRSHLDFHFSLFLVTTNNNRNDGIDSSQNEPSLGGIIILF